MSSNTVPNGGTRDDPQSTFFPEAAFQGGGRDWRGEIAQRVAAHKARSSTVVSQARPSPPASSERAASVSHRALQNVRRRMEEREAREEAARRERQELELFFAGSDRTLITHPEPTPSTTKVIRFPRTATLLAEEDESSPPNQLTIFEDQHPSEGIDDRTWHFHPVRPAYSALRLDEPAELASAVETGRRPEEIFELPLKVAPFTLRGTAALVDLALVLVCALLFASTFYGIQHQVPHGKSAFISALLVSWILWVIYQFLFLAYTGSTPGLRLTRLGISDFEDGVPTPRMRVARAGALVLSSLSCGLGFIWTLLDEDRLAWHDRMTRTFPRQLA